jgi:CheY-like chemotaxis protein
LRGERAESLRAGIEAYLVKPVRQSELYDALATVMATPEEAKDRYDERLVTRGSLREARAALPRVLVVEDNPVNQMVARKMLERLGCRVDVAADGVEALAALSSGGPYSLMCMDVQMPNMDGHEATAEIRRGGVWGGESVRLHRGDDGQCHGGRQGEGPRGRDGQLPTSQSP